MIKEKKIDVLNTQVSHDNNEDDGMIEMRIQKKSNAPVKNDKESEPLDYLVDELLFEHLLPKKVGE